MNMPLLLFENQVFAHSIKRRLQRKRSRKEEKWMNKWQKVLLEILMRHQERTDVQQLNILSKILEPEPSQSTIQALSNATQKRSEAESRNLNRTLSSEEITV